MLEQDISNIICFIQARGAVPSEPSRTLLHCLEDLEDISKMNFIVYDFEANRLFFANEQAADFLDIDHQDFSKHGDAFLESVIHPVSYQFMQYKIRLNKAGSEESFSGVYYLKTKGKSKYAWVYASARVMSFNASGVPRLIYACFVEVDKAMECYLKILHGGVNSSREANPIELLQSLKSREVEMLSLIASECTSKEMADKLSISQAALDAARKRLIKKLGVRSITGLVKIAISLGISGQEMPPRVYKSRKIKSRSINSIRIAGDKLKFEL